MYLMIGMSEEPQQDPYGNRERWRIWQERIQVAIEQAEGIVYVIPGIYTFNRPLGLKDSMSFNVGIPDGDGGCHWDAPDATVGR